MDGERSASENLAKRAFFGSSQNLAISKPRLRKYDSIVRVQYCTVVPCTAVPTVRPYGRT